jgi:hypothetical protein
LSASHCSGFQEVKSLNYKYVRLCRDVLTQYSRIDWMQAITLLNCSASVTDGVAGFLFTYQPTALGGLLVPLVLTTLWLEYLRRDLRRKSLIRDAESVALVFKVDY